jgi:hypothetical protein
MHLGVALTAEALEVDRVVCAAFFDLDDVMHLQLHRRAKALQVVFISKALPAPITAAGRQQRPKVLV